MDNNKDLETFTAENAENASEALSKMALILKDGLDCLNEFLKDDDKGGGDRTDLIKSMLAVTMVKSSLEAIAKNHKDAADKLRSDKSGRGPIEVLFDQ